jgi:triosephosphate isomerase (TIM)
MKKLIVANWKLNPISAKDAVKLTSQIKKTKKNTVVLCPPHIYLSSVKYPNLGAQDCFWENKGAFTGQVSPAQLKNLKIKYCIVGHSEKRSTGENDVQINFKIHALLENGITPILCVGYGTTAEEDDLAVVDVLKTQLEQSLKGIDATKVVVAYEPVWAISTGNSIGHKTPTPEHAEKIGLFIKTRFGVETVLYGGSANILNAKSFLDQENVDGLLVGGDSLIAKHFNEIINI